VSPIVAASSTSCSTSSNLAVVSGLSGSKTSRVDCRPARRQVNRLSSSIAAREKTPREGAPRENSHTQPLAGRQDVRFVSPQEKRVGRLLGAEALEAAALRDMVRLDDLACGESRAAEGADLPVPDEIGEGGECLLDVRRRIGRWI
jgi:hypothetical protein